MRQVILHGRLEDKFGSSFRLQVATAGEALRALNAAFPGKFVEELRYGSYRVIRGRRHGGMELGLDTINSLNLGSADLHIVPVAHGAANKGGTTKAIAGVALIGAAVFLSGGTLAAPLAGMGGAVVPGLALTYGNIAQLGLGLALAGIASHLAGAGTSPQDSASADPAQSFTLSGPVNVNEQGNAVPLIYGGPIIVGSQPISSGFDIENVGAY